MKITTTRNPADLFAVDELKDWPFGHGENDNYHNECCVCGGKFRGHKNALACYACHKAAQRWWEGLSDKEKERETEERYAEINRVMRKIFKIFKKENAAGTHL